VTETSRGLGGAKYWALLNFRGAAAFATEVTLTAKNPPLSVRATVRSRRWYMDQLEREVTMQTASSKLYLTEDFQEAARAFAEKRQPGPFKGR
jgi:enoyl-CoA hydratase/carnithine racemase